jgi:hypothetical protein
MVRTSLREEGFVRWRQSHKRPLRQLGRALVVDIAFTP